MFILFGFYKLWHTDIQLSRNPCHFTHSWKRNIYLSFLSRIILEQNKSVFNIECKVLCIFWAFFSVLCHCLRVVPMFVTLSVPHLSLSCPYLIQLWWRLKLTYMINSNPKLDRWGVYKQNYLYGLFKCLKEIQEGEIHVSCSLCILQISSYIITCICFFFYKTKYIPV